MSPRHANVYEREINKLDRLPDIYNFFDNLKPDQPRPWKSNGGADRDKYFNYGFTESTWQAHVESVLNARDVSKTLSVVKRKEFSHDTLNFSLPHNFGGFGDPTDLEHVNLFTEEVDLPLIKPHTLQQNQQ